jgi:CelD/BcsL family acetyltransferase involved in cellulose biosynthesis
LHERFRAPRTRREFSRLDFLIGLNTRPEICSLATADQVRGYLLFLDDVAMSYMLCPAVDQRLNYSYLGFRPEYADHSPGTVLQFLAVESMFTEQRFRLLDLGEGGKGQHKRIFATHTVECANVLYLRDNALSRLIVRTHRSWNFAVGKLDGIFAEATSGGG